MEEKRYAPNYKLRRVRELKGWTQKEVADRIDLPDTRTLRRWECGDAIPSLRYRTKLCEVFEVGPAELGLLTELPVVVAPAPIAVLEKPPASTEPTGASEAASINAPFMLQALPSLDDVASTMNNRNRQRLIKKVLTFWIKDILEPSFENSPRLSLALQVLPDTVQNPWQHVVQPARVNSCLNSGSTLLDVFDEACGELLLLGDVGSGKTTLLLELAQALLYRATEQSIHPIPVIFNLASWEEKHLPLTNWLVEELCNKYQVPQKVGLEWIENDDILPLIDGFEQVRPALRLECLVTINEYRQLHGLVPFVLCSQKEAYCSVAKPVLLQQAVCIQELAPQHIDTYLSQRENPLETLRIVLQNDEELRGLVRTPRILGKLAAAYRDIQSEELASLQSMEMKRRHVLATYIACTLEDSSPSSLYSTQKSIAWLSYLARQMKIKCQCEFKIEHLHLDWLSSTWMKTLCSSSLLSLRITLLTGAFLTATLLVLHTTVYNKTMPSSSSEMLFLFMGCALFWCINLLTEHSDMIMKGTLASQQEHDGAHSLYHALGNGIAAGSLYGVLFTLLGSIASFVFPLFTVFSSNVILYAFLLGLATCVIVSLQKVCGSWMRYRLLKCILWFGGYVPWHFSQFLDYAAEHVLLCKVGEGYSFSHHLLLDYFATGIREE